MRDAARALDDVSDHLGEVLRRADELLAEWSGLGVQVRAQVEREVAAIGEVVDGAVARAAGSGIDRAIADRLRALTAEIERLEQRTRAASRAVSEQREGDRRVLWIVVAGVVLANALIVVLLLRKPDPAPVAEPIRIETPAAAPLVEPAQETTGGPGPATGSASSNPAASAGGSGASAIAPAASAGATPAGNGGSPAASAGSTPAGNGGSPAVGNAGSTPAGNGGSTAAGSAGSNTAGHAGAKPGSTAPSSAGAKQQPPPSSAVRPVNEPPHLTPSPIVLPPRSGSAHGHKKQP